MPFTLAHPLGALPFKWIKPQWFSTTGLVVGSMAPDYEYFLKMQLGPTIGETFWGAIFFDFPLAFLFALVFHLLIKRPLIHNLPQPYDRYYSGYAQTSFLTYLGKHWLVFITSIMIGIATHFLLDWVTQPIHGPLKKTVLTEVITLGPLRSRPSIIIERIFDVTATLVLIWMVLRLRNPAPDYTKAPSSSKLIYWSLFFLMAAAMVGSYWYQDGWFTGVAIASVVIISAVASGILVASVLIRLVRRQPIER